MGTNRNCAPWEVIFNEKMYGWGVGFGAKASADREYDVLSVSVPTGQTAESVELFTIAFDEGESLYLTLKWDDTQVRVPISGE